MNTARTTIATLIAGQAIYALAQGATLVTPACAAQAQRLNDQLNTAFLLAVLLWAGGFWSNRHG